MVCANGISRRVDPARGVKKLYRHVLCITVKALIRAYSTVRTTIKNRGEGGGGTSEKPCCTMKLQRHFALSSYNKHDPTEQTINVTEKETNYRVTSVCAHPRFIKHIPTTTTIISTTTMTRAQPPNNGKSSHQPPHPPRYLLVAISHIRSLIGGDNEVLPPI